MRGAKGVLINICGGPDLTLFEVDEAANRIREEVDPSANIIFGSTFEDSLEGKVRLSLVATGIDAEATMPRLRDFANKRSEAGSASQPVLTAISGSRDSAAQVAQPAPIGQPALDPPGTPVLQPVAQAAAQLEPEDGATQPAPVPHPVAAEKPAVAATSHGAPAGGNRPFIPPRPIAAAAQHHQRRAPDPFAEAAVANGGRVTASKASLFERMTGTGRARKLSVSGDKAHFAPPAATETGVSSLFRPAPKTKFPRDEAVAPGKPEPRVSTGSRDSEDDLLEIPAFLRRQAN